MPNKAKQHSKSDPVSTAKSQNLPKELYLESNTDQDNPWDWYLKDDTEEGVYVVYVPVRVVNVTTKNVRKETVI